MPKQGNFFLKEQILEKLNIILVNILYQQKYML